uniref:Cytochrome P450 n=1 Tax=Talaromyces marneffei PM1 TaxID=1077442 RepID=A0A093VGW9_TALMA
MDNKIYLFIIFAAVFFLVRRLIRYISVARFKRRHGCKPAKQLPQREKIIGFAYFRIQAEAVKKKRLMALQQERYDTYGNTWSLVLMGARFYTTIEVENVKAVLATNFKDFGLGMRQVAFDPLLGQDGEQWEHSRALVRPNFIRSQVADLDLYETHIQILFSKIPRDGSMVDLQPLFFQLTLDSATEFLFGESVSSLTSVEGSSQHRFGKMFDLAQNRLNLRARLGKLVMVYRDKEFDRACQIVHEFVDEIIYRALERFEPRDAEKPIDGSGEKKRYVFLNELLKSTRDPKRLRDELLNILMAGRDTTASLLSHTFHLLARRPDIWQKLQAEIAELNGTKPDYDTLRNLKYVKYVLNESLRYYPVVPSNGRIAVKDTILPRGGGPNGESPLFVPKGAIVGFTPWVMHRRKDIYGPDAHEFRPERWAPEEGLRPGWGYLPFGGGPRICLGQQFALTEASYTIVRILQEFARIENRDGGDWVEKLNVTLSPGNGVKVTMIPGRTCI